MTRINTNVSALVAQNNLTKSNTDLQTRLERLSTGLKINRGSDDPAGLIVSERLRGEIASIHTAVDNSQRASNVISTTEAALSEVSDLLTSIKGLAIQAANSGAFSPDEVRANQLQIDSAIESITRIANTASFAGLKLLNGSLDYTLAGVNNANVQDIHVFGANFGTATSIPVTVDVLASAQTGQLFISGGAAPTITQATTIEIQGTKGVQAVQIASNSTFAQVAAAINQFREVTGVSASVFNTSGLKLESTELGSDAFVSVVQKSGPQVAFVDQLDGTSANRDAGKDVLALVNGNLALGKGQKVSLHSTLLNLELTLSQAAAQSVAQQTFTITGGGARYQIGSQVNIQQQVGFGIQSVAASSLGNAQAGYLNSIGSDGVNALIAGDAATQARKTSDIIDAAIDQISSLRGRLGAFEANTLQVAVRSQQIALENLTSSESQIRDTDFAAETSALTRAQILQQAGTSTLALANSSAQQVLKLLQ